MKDAGNKVKVSPMSLKARHRFDRELAGAINDVKRRIMKRDGTHLCSRCAGVFVDKEWNTKYSLCLSCAKKYQSDYGKSPRGRAAAKKHYDKMALTPELLCRVRIRGRVAKAMRMCARGRKSCGSKIKYLGCTYSQAFKYLSMQLKRGMNWKNYGTHWHIDHVMPVSSFDLNTEDGRYKAFHYTNLQPLEASANLHKSDKVPLQHQPSLMIV
jgi:hypothetical protein